MIFTATDELLIRKEATSQRLDRLLLPLSLLLSRRHQKQNKTMEAAEEKPPSNPSHDLHHQHQTQDATIQKKHDLMLERLSNLHNTRLHNSSTRKSADSNSLESTQSFLSRFSDSKHFIDSQLSACRLTSPTDPNSLKSQIEKISGSIADLEKLVAENSYFLPSYDVRSSLKTVSDLKQALESLSFELIPKKKFSFRNKSAKKDHQPNVTNEAPILQPDSGFSKKMSLEVRDSPGLRGKEGEVLVQDFNGSDIGEFTISDLESCEVRLKGCVRALFVHRLRNCKVYAGPVFGSILIEEAENCVLVLASHQIRIHSAKACDFYLRVRSRPIIEDCSGVRFAPYCLGYDGIEKDLIESSLNEETGNWANVDDFRWLRAVQSPNWSILPESERVGYISISNSESGSEEIYRESFLNGSTRLSSALHCI